MQLEAWKEVVALRDEGAFSVEWVRFEAEVAEEIRNAVPLAPALVRESGLDPQMTLRGTDVPPGTYEGAALTLSFSTRKWFALKVDGVWFTGISVRQALERGRRS